MTKDMNIISALADEPNDEGGLSAEQLKAKFDEAGNTMKSFINDSLVPDLDAEIAAQLSEIMTTSGNLPTDGTAGQVLAKRSAAKFDVEFRAPSAAAQDVTLSQSAATALGSAANAEAGLLAVAQNAADTFLRSDRLKVGSFAISTTSNIAATSAITVSLGAKPLAVFMQLQTTVENESAAAYAINLPLNTYYAAWCRQLSTASKYVFVRFTASGFNVYNSGTANGYFNGTVNYLAIMP